MKTKGEDPRHNIETYNSFHYRGYIYDEETGFYYLQSRYYDPVTGRFLNADTCTDTESGSPLSTNMFAYCENNSISGLDKTGQKQLKISQKEKYTFNYDRKKAIEYAEDYYNVTNLYIITFGNNHEYKYYHGRDCANFVSQCLYAGGIPMTSKWYHYSYSKTYHGDSTQVTYDVSKSWRLVKNQKNIYKNIYQKNQI